MSPCTRCQTVLEIGDLRCAICGLLAPVLEKAALVRIEAKIVRCSACGASVSWSAEAAAPTCAFCASVVKIETPSDPVEQAEATLPFSVNPQAAASALKTWLGTRGFFRPSDLAQASTIDSMKAVFWPAWIFNARALVSWAADSNADSGRASWAPHAGQTTLDFDNLLLGHQDRRRVIADAHKPRIFTPGLRVEPSLLVDGFAAGSWKVERKKGVATLLIDPFEKLSKATRGEVESEADRLVRFMEPDAETFAVGRNL